MSRRAKVLHVCSAGFTLRTLMLPLIDVLRREYEVTILCDEDELSREVQASGYDVQFLGIGKRIRPWQNLKTLLRLRRIMREGKYDLAHFHAPLAGILGRIAARLAGVPVVFFTVRGFYFHEHTPPLQKRLFTFAEQVCGRLSDFIFIQSGEDHQAALDLGIAPPECLMHLGNGINLERFRPEDIPESTREALRRSFGFLPGEPVVGILGRVVKEKGYREWAKAADLVIREFPSARFLAIGDNEDSGGDGAMAEVRAFVEEKGLQDRVVFAGHRYDIPELMSLMDVYTLPSYREGMPRSLMEAMSMGKATVATNIRGCREEVVEGETGFLVPVADAEALADRILCLLRDPELRARMGRKGRERAEHEFDEKRVIARQVDVYARILKEKGL